MEVCLLEVDAKCNIWYVEFSVMIVFMNSTFLLAWIVLPIQNEFHNSGHFSFCGKVIEYWLLDVFAFENELTV